MIFLNLFYFNTLRFNLAHLLKNEEDRILILVYMVRNPLLIVTKAAQISVFIFSSLDEAVSTLNMKFNIADVI